MLCSLPKNLEASIIRQISGRKNRTAVAYKEKKLHLTKKFGIYHQRKNNCRSFWVEKGNPSVLQRASAQNVENGSSYLCIADEASRARGSTTV